jgi:hypothetical protein
VVFLFLPPVGVNSPPLQFNPVSPSAIETSFEQHP